MWVNNGTLTEYLANADTKPLVLENPIDPGSGRTYDFRTGEFHTSTIVRVQASKSLTKIYVGIDY